jgi:trans-2,3-dihydro-3-hydroxyanthranilate isomerase
VFEYDNGMRHVFVVAESFEAVARIKPRLDRLAELTEAGVSVLAARGTSVKTRMFAPALGVSEDPATGSAAGPLAVHLCEHGATPFGEVLHIAQGAEVGRPSELSARVHGTSGQVTRVEVGGAAVIVGRGELRVS